MRKSRLRHKDSAKTRVSRHKKRRQSFEQLEQRRLLFATAIHEQLTEAAFPEIISGGSGAPLVLEDIINEHAAQNDALDAATQADHFHGSRFREAALKINQWYRDAVEYADPSDFSSEHLADAFGNVVHAVQDFYAHSNWTELQAASLVTGGSLLDAGDSWFGNLAPYSLVSGAMLVQGEDETPLGPGSNLKREGAVVAVDTGNRQSQAVGDVHQGIAVHEPASGVGYLMYSKSSLFARFSGKPPLDDASGRNSDSGSTTRRTRIPRRTHFWLHRQWSTAGDERFRDARTLVQRAARSPHRSNVGSGNRECTATIELFGIHRPERRSLGGRLLDRQPKRSLRSDSSW